MCKVDGLAISVSGQIKPTVPKIKREQKETALWSAAAAPQTLQFQQAAQARPNTNYCYPTTRPSFLLTAPLRWWRIVEASSQFRTSPGLSFLVQAEWLPHNTSTRQSDVEHSPFLSNSTWQACAVKKVRRAKSEAEAPEMQERLQYNRGLPMLSTPQLSVTRKCVTVNLPSNVSLEDRLLSMCAQPRSMQPYHRGCLIDKRSI